MMGAGKTAVGQAIAAELGVPFHDSDTEIVKAANSDISEIFERHGEAFFREKEGQVLRRLLGGPPSILATGGGAYLASANREAISAAGIAVWLRADLDLLWSRVRHKTTRPLLQTPQPRETLARLLEERTPSYARAEIVVETQPGNSVTATAAEVIEALAGRPDVVERNRD